MSKLTWDQVGERTYETGVEQCALYPFDTAKNTYGSGVAWNGITKVEENPSGGEASPVYANNKKYLNLMSAEEFAATIGAYTYPDEFAECDGSKEIAPGVYAGQQSRKTFGLAYKSLKGNDTEGTDYGYKIHLVYGCLAAPSSKAYNTVNESPEAGEMSWTVSTTPVDVPDAKPSATIVVDSTKCDKDKLKQLEDIIYGTDSAEAKLPMPKEIIELVGAGAASSVSETGAVSDSE